MVEVTNEILLERLTNFLEKNNEDHAYLKEAIRQLTNNEGEHEDRIRKLEDWRLVFVTKYTVYSAIALFLGSIISTIAYQIISKYI